MPLAVCPSWHLAEDFLVEEHPGGVRLWGRWDRTFGCWDQNGHEIILQGPILGRLGVWMEPPGDRDDTWYAERAAVAAYWSLVPTTVRLLASKEGAGQWAALMEMWQARVGCVTPGMGQHRQVWAAAG